MFVPRMFLMNIVKFIVTRQYTCSRLDATIHDRNCALMNISNVGLIFRTIGLKYKHRDIFSEFSISSYVQIIKYISQYPKIYALVVSILHNLPNKVFFITNFIITNNSSGNILHAE